MTMPTKAAASTVEALVYSCRQGPSALDTADNMRRLAQLDEAHCEKCTSECSISVLKFNMRAAPLRAGTAIRRTPS
jgi:hypothetical protein